MRCLRRAVSRSAELSTLHLKRGAGAFERAFRRFDNGFDLRSTTRNQLTRARCGIGEKIGNGIDAFPLLRQSCRGRFGAHVHPLPDQLGRHRIQAAGDLDMQVPGDLRRGEDRHVIASGRCQQQQGLLGGGEVFARPLIGAAVQA